MTQRSPKVACSIKCSKGMSRAKHPGRCAFAGPPELLSYIKPTRVDQNAMNGHKISNKSQLPWLNLKRNYKGNTRFKIQEFSRVYWHNSDRCKFHQRNTRKTIQACIQLTQQKTHSYTMNIDYKFLCIWISSFSLNEYIVEMYLQNYDMASGGQWRPRMYFSWYTSSFILNDGIHDQS